jgi:hypothetical protein
MVPGGAPPNPRMQPTGWGGPQLRSGASHAEAKQGPELLSGRSLLEAGRRKR